MLCLLAVSVCGCDVLFTDHPTLSTDPIERSAGDTTVEAPASEELTTEEPEADPTDTEEDAETTTEPEESGSEASEETTEIFVHIETEASSSDEDASKSTLDIIDETDETGETDDETEDSTEDSTKGTTTSPRESTPAPTPTASEPGTEMVPAILVDKYPAGLPTTVMRPSIQISNISFAAATQYNGTANTYRLAQVIKKAQAGQPVTIGLIGGSITQGAGATSKDLCYASILEAFWRNNFPNSPLTFINAGIGATDSYLGVHRVSGLLSANPDFVIVEFSVNDEPNEKYQNYYENLVRRIKAAPSSPAVLLIFMTMSNYVDASAYDIPVGQKYSVPMISYRDAIIPSIRAKEFRWNKIAVDTVHPSNDGHSLLARYIIHYLYTVIDSVNAGTYSPADVPVPGNAVAYANAEIYDNRNVKPTSVIGFAEGSNDSESFKHGWTTCEIGGEPETTPEETSATRESIPETGITVIVEETTTEAPATTPEETQPTTAKPTTAPTTAAPTKPAPTTAAPTTAAPTTAAPTKPAPTTAAPTTAAPSTAAPTTAAPTTAAPKKTALTDTIFNAFAAKAAAPKVPAEAKNPAPSASDLNEITFTVNAKNIGLLFRVYRDGTGQVMQVFIDGNYVGILNGQGVNEAASFDRSIEFYTSGVVAEHTITIRLDPSAGGSRFALEGLLLS